LPPVSVILYFVRIAYDCIEAPDAKP
jgi:hypothetical protein